MKDDYWVVPAVVVVLALALVMFVFGFTAASNKAYGACMQYHKTLPLQDVEPLCKNITGV